MRSTPLWIETLYSKFDTVEPRDSDGRSLGVRRYVVRPGCEEELKGPVSRRAGPPPGSANSLAVRRARRGFGRCSRFVSDSVAVTVPL
jgi:hypothetical protein